MAAASRRLTAPRRGALAMTTSRLAKGGRRDRVRPPLAIEAHEHPRRHAKIIEHDQPEIAQAPREIAFAAVTRPARDRARGKDRDLAPLEAAHEIDVLHERERAEAAEPPVKLARDEKPLVAVRQGKQETAQAHHFLNEARHEPVVVEREAEEGGSLLAAPG